MTTPHHTPPGRAARLRLRHSLDVALRGADLLEQKLRILRTEHQRRLDAEAAARHDWHERLQKAETWLLRGLLLSGEHALETSTPTARADVTLTWTTTMGVHHPDRASCTPAERTPTEPTPGNTALAHAEAAYRDALRTAAEYATATAAARLLGAEVHTTRRRVRALRRHWIPRLTGTLTAIDLALEQAEHEDTVRRRWAAERR
jgi:V/A-type H+/Na+-transporting ATPase subunit D